MNTDNLQIQKLMYKFYEYMNSEEVAKFEKENQLQNEYPHNIAIMYLEDKMDKNELEKMSVATALGNLNYQVENGGIHQWVFNGYYQHGLDVLIPFLEKVMCYFDQDSDDYKLAKLIFDQLDIFAEYDPEAGEWDVECEECGGCGRVYDYDEECDIVCYECCGTGTTQVYDFVYVVEHVIDDNFDSEFYKFDTISIFENWIQKYDEIINCKGDAVKPEVNDKRVKVKLVGEDGNIFNLIGIVVKEMRKARLPKEKIDEFTKEVTSAGSYDEALQIIMKYVDVC